MREVEVLRFEGEEIVGAEVYCGWDLDWGTQEVTTLAERVTSAASGSCS